jgi:hypothetical protein
VCYSSLASRLLYREVLSFKNPVAQSPRFDDGSCSPSDNLAWANTPSATADTCLFLLYPGTELVRYTV